MSNVRMCAIERMELPDLVQRVITSACSSGRTLSWKIQVSEKGTLIQLVWKKVSSNAVYPQRNEAVVQLEQ